MLTALILTTQPPTPDYCNPPAPFAVVRQAPDSPDGEPRVIWTEGDSDDCVEV